jgi:hypothetical protein
VRQQKKTAADIFDAAESNGIRPVEETDINSDPAPRVLQPGTEGNYSRMLDHWDEYVSGVLACLRESADYHPPRWNRYERRYLGANVRG